MGEDPQVQHVGVGEDEVGPAADLVARLKHEYEATKARLGVGR